MADFRPSPFLDPGPRTQDGQLALVHLKRDLLTPIVLNSADDGGSEWPAVINTRFGSFPHTGLVNIPWGTQVRATNVNTGSRGRGGRKRKRDQDTPADDEDSNATSAREAGPASTGFVHIMPPTPETWTISLPHRTQVVYTPDYSYVLQRLRARPGDTLIEAGAGSGSFTHAAVRAVFNGYPLSEGVNGTEKKKRKRSGHVYSFEFHEPRAVQLRKELQEHGLDRLVTVTHADVYENGFSGTEDGSTPQADAIFLDLPAPWLALKHLSRNRPTEPASTPPTTGADQADAASWRSPLNPRKTIRLCTFSPCIEQVQRTTTELRRLGWTSIEMVEVLHHRIDVRRERIGLQEEGLRGVIATPATVDEAVGRLRDVEGRFKEFHETVHGPGAKGGQEAQARTGGQRGRGWGKESKEQRLRNIREREKERKTFKEGRLVHRTEPEIKTHTSYLCFALLPREWTAEDEERARKKWHDAVVEETDEKGGKQGGEGGIKAEGEGDDGE